MGARNTNAVPRVLTGCTSWGHHRVKEWRYCGPHSCTLLVSAVFEKAEKWQLQHCLPFSLLKILIEASSCFECHPPLFLLKTVAIFSQRNRGRLASIAIEKNNDQVCSVCGGRVAGTAFSAARGGATGNWTGSAAPTPPPAYHPGHFSPLAPPGMPVT